MKKAEALRFLADRLEDGKEFVIDDCRIFKFSLGAFYEFNNNSGLWLGTRQLQLHELYEIRMHVKKEFNLTEDEKVILRNLNKNLNWIARNKNGSLVVFEGRPVKDTETGYWWTISYKGKEFYIDCLFGDLFKCIEWSDNDPCEFKIILEKGYIKT